MNKSNQRINNFVEYLRVPKMRIYTFDEKLDIGVVSRGTEEVQIPQLPVHLNLHGPEKQYKS